MAENNLLGKSHKQYVQDQIKVRQEILGKSTRDSKELSWMNGKTSWVRLASSIDIVNTTTKQKVVVGTVTTSTTSTQTTDQGSIEKTTTTTSEVTQEQNVVDTINGTPVGEKRLELLDLNDSYMGDTLANNLVLHGGVEKHSFNPDEMSKRYGIAEVYSNTVQTFQAYNSKNGDFGLVAMPGIESVDIKSKSMGSLREATISLRINDPEQLELIETLYLRIGYSVFLEWGNSSYYKKDQLGLGNHKYVTGVDVEPGLLFDFLSPSEELKKCPTNFIKKIEEKREKSEGNYDALFGRVKNFSWEFNPQGFYNATLEIISWGDIIESLQIDGFYPDIVLSKLNEGGGNENPSDEIEKKDESLLNGFIYEASLPTQKIKKATFQTTSPGSVPKLQTNTTEYSVVKNHLIAQVDITEFIQFKGTTQTNTSTTSDYSSALKYDRSLTNSFEKTISGIALFNDTPYSYVRLGDILDFIKTRLSLYLENCSTSIVDINTDTDTNYCYNPEVNVSADPSKVMINSTIPTDIRTLESLANSRDRDYVVSNPQPGDNEIRREIFGLENFQGKNVKLEPFTQNKVLSKGKQIANVPVGLIMNIYFEKEFLYNTVDQLRDEKTGQLSLYKFIKTLLDEANSCLGGVNKLDLRIVNDQTLEIYDQVPLYGWKDNQDLPQEFNIFGLKPTKETINIGGATATREYNDGSFVTNFGLKTELTNEFATITSIGAQVNGSVVGEDGTFLSKWNFGLVDRFYSKKLDSYRKQDQQQDEDLDQKEYLALLKKITNLWSDYSIQTYKYKVVSEGGGINNKVYTGYRFPYFKTNSYSQYVKIQKDFLKAFLKLRTKEQNVLSNQIGMLPINLNLEMDGISGIRIYDQIRVNTRFLPSYYPEYLIFIIKGVSHSFNGNRWITKIDTIAQPKVQFDTPVKLEITDGDVSSFQNAINKALKYNGIMDTSKIIPWESSLDTYFPVAEPVTYRTSDNFGAGSFGAGRGDRLHYGVDIEVTPGQEIYSPIPGIMRKIESIYGDGSHPELKGIEITGTGEYLGWYAQILYVDMDYYNKFQTKAGYVIGKAQDMASSYGNGMTNHIHYSLYKGSRLNRKFVDTESLLKNYYSLPVPASGDGVQQDPLFEEEPLDNTPTPSKESEENNTSGYETLPNPLDESMEDQLQSKLDLAMESANQSLNQPLYIARDKVVTKDEFINIVNQSTKEEIQTGVWRVENDDKVLGYLLLKLSESP